MRAKSIYLEDSLPLERGQTGGIHRSALQGNSQLQGIFAHCFPRRSAGSGKSTALESSGKKAIPDDRLTVDGPGAGRISPIDI
jgi:hypothetical protein